MAGTTNIATGTESPRKNRRDMLASAWWTGVSAVSGDQCVADYLRKHPLIEPDIIIALGKAATSMSHAAAQTYGFRPIVLSVTKYGHAVETVGTVLEAAHPVPDENSLLAGRRILQVLGEARKTDRLMLLISGGASSLVEHLVAGTTLTDLKELNKKLLASGEPIERINAERSKLSQIKGGKLLRHFSGQHVDVLAISDVAGDGFQTIASGIGLVPTDAAFSFSAAIIASNSHARLATLNAISRHGITPVEESETLYGPLSEVCERVVTRVLSGLPGAYVFGGEPTVVLPEVPGRGGRNQALGLALARALSGHDNIDLLIGGTDGTDGPTQDAGAFVDGSMWSDFPGGECAFKAFDSGNWLERAGALFTTGPTGTNVMDLLVAVKS